MNGKNEVHRIISKHAKTKQEKKQETMNTLLSDCMQRHFFLSLAATVKL
jgi:hypothetical protein